MLTVNPNDQQKLVEDIKAVDKTKKPTPQPGNIEPSQNASQIDTKSSPKPKIRQDTQLSVTEIDEAKEYSILPEEVGYVTKFPVSGHVQAWIYLIFVPVFAYELFIATSNNYDPQTTGIEATKASLGDVSSYGPAFALFMILIIITCIYSRKTFMHYLGAAFALLAFLGQIYFLSVSLSFNLLDISRFQEIGKLSNFSGSTYNYSLVVTIFIYFYSFLYFLLPKYRNTYQ